jgi:HK97 family phage portal protein
VRLISDVEAMLPLITYRRTDRGKDRARNHYLYEVLHDLPNPEMTAMTYRQTVTGHVALRGNGLSEVEFDGAGRVKYLWPLNPDKVQKMERRGRGLYYVYTLPGSVGGQNVGIPADRVLHVRWISKTGYWAMSPIQMARQSVATSLAAQDHMARFFANNAEPGVVLKTSEALSDKAYERVQSDWEAQHKGLEKSHRVAILEEGLSVEHLGMNHTDAQFLQLLGYGTGQIARLYGISLDMLAEADKAATYASVEQFGERFVKYVMQPWLTRWEQEIYRTLLTPAERKEYFAEHLVDALLRASITERMQAYVSGIQNAIYTPNDVLSKENMNTYEGGDVHVIGLNMDDIENVGKPDANSQLRVLDAKGETRAAPTPADGFEIRGARSAASRRRMMLSQRRVFHDVTARVIKREVRDVLEAAKKAFAQRDAQTFTLWLDQYYQKHEEFVRRSYSATMAAYAENVADVAGDEINADAAQYADSLDRFARSYVASFASRYVGINLNNIRQQAQDALAQEDPATALETSLEAYQDVRAGEVARWESNRENNAAARLVYVMAGFPKLKWRSGDDCAYCKSLNDQEIGIDEYFLRAGDEYQPEGADAPFSVKHDTGHPPLCNGCDCLITAAK